MTGEAARVQAVQAAITDAIGLATLLDRVVLPSSLDSCALVLCWARLEQLTAPDAAPPLNAVEQVRDRLLVIAARVRVAIA